jgi:hypothetical protein
MKLKANHKRFLFNLANNTTSQDTHRGKVYQGTAGGTDFVVLRQPTFYDWRSSTPREEQRKKKKKTYNLLIGNKPTQNTFWGERITLPVWRIVRTAEIRK